MPPMVTKLQEKQIEANSAMQAGTRLSMPSIVREGFQTDIWHKTLGNLQKRMYSKDEVAQFIMQLNMDEINSIEIRRNN